MIFCHVDLMLERGYVVGSECHYSLNGVLLCFGKFFVRKDDFAMLGRAHRCGPMWPFSGEPRKRVVSSHGHLYGDRSISAVRYFPGSSEGLENPLVYGG